MSSAASTGASYDIGRSTGTCAATGEPIEPGAPCVTALREATAADEHAESGFVRLDFSVEGWERGPRPEHLFSWWRTVAPHPTEKRRLLLEDDALLDMFERMADESDERRLGFRFVLGLILTRKRLLRILRTRRTDAGTIYELRRRGSDPELPPIEMLDPGISDEDAGVLSEQLGAVMADGVIDGTDS